MPERIHVCFITLSFGENSAGGVMHHMVALARELHARGDRVSIICPSYGEPWRYRHEEFIDVIGIQEAAIDHRLAPAMVGFGRRTGAALLSLHREHPIDVIHLHDRPPWLGAASAARHVRIPLVYTAHSLMEPTGAEAPLASLMLRMLERRIAHSRIPIVAVSEWVRTGLIRLGAQPDRVTVIPNGVDTQTFSFGDPEQRDPGTILFVGRLEEEKGVDVLLHAAARLAPARRFQLTVAGTGTQEATYRRLTATLGLEDRVQFVGMLDAIRLADAYRRAAVCVLPSRIEPFGMVMLEAMAGGAPFVGSEVGGIREVVLPGETGLLVPPDDPAALAATLARVLDDRALAVYLGHTAREFVAQRYQWGHIAAQTRLLYERPTSDARANNISSSLPAR